MIKNDENQNVILADDDDDDFQLFAEAISSLSLNVSLTRAANGNVLIKLLNEQVPDILFLDMLMPYKDGKDCILAIRAQAKFDQLPIIIYTSLSDAATIEFCFRKGTNLFILKPNTFDGIIEIVKKVFSIDWKKTRYYPSLPDFVLNKAT